MANILFLVPLSLGQAATVWDHTRHNVAVISTIIPSSFNAPAQNEHLLQAVRRSASTLLHCPALAAEC